LPPGSRTSCIRPRRAHPGLSLDSPDDEIIEDRILTAAALKYVGEHPWRTLRTKALNVLHFLSPRPVPYWTIGDDTHLVIGQRAADERSAARCPGRCVRVAPR
jgi:hypothetical protein